MHLHNTHTSCVHPPICIAGTHTTFPSFTHNGIFYSISSHSHICITLYIHIRIYLYTHIYRTCIHSWSGEWVVTVLDDGAVDGGCDGLDRATVWWAHGRVAEMGWMDWMYECVHVRLPVRPLCHVFCLSSSSYPASSCSSCVQGPCQLNGASGQCRCIIVVSWSDRC